MLMYPTTDRDSQSNVIPRSSGQKQIDGFVRVLKLRLELDLSDLSSDELQILRKHAKTDHGIHRDILAPDEMTLHALHYAIQRAFGWSNNHPHHFSLPEPVFNAYSGGSFAQWSDWCGVYFRFPMADTKDLYWDDDYRDHTSFRTWLRSKYCGPYHYGGTSESYEACRTALDEFRNRVQTVEAMDLRREWPDDHSERRIPLHDASLDEAFYNPEFTPEPNALLEHLTLGKLLGTSRDEPITSKLIYHYDYSSNWKINIYLQAYTGATEQQLKKLSALKPVCVDRAGIDLMENTCGVAGFCALLHDLYEGPQHRQTELRNWVRDLDWGTRLVPIDQIL